jgi:hypothetical protein
LNTANLQLEGILLALYALLDTMKRKGVLNQQEIDDALRQAEGIAAFEGRERDELSRANVEAICFPIRFLREANSASKAMESFAAITQLVAEKNDKRF